MKRIYYKYKPECYTLRTTLRSRVMGQWSSEYGPHYSQNFRHRCSSSEGVSDMNRRTIINSNDFTDDLDMKSFSGMGMPPEHKFLQFP